MPDSVRAIQKIHDDWIDNFYEMRAIKGNNSKTLLDYFLYSFLSSCGNDKISHYSEQMQRHFPKFKAELAAAIEETKLQDKLERKDSVTICKSAFFSDQPQAKSTPVSESPTPSSTVKKPKS